MGELRFFDEESRHLYGQGFTERSGPDIRPERRGAHLVLMEVQLMDEEQRLAEDLASDSRMVACAQWAFGMEPAAADREVQERIMDEGFQGTLDDLRKEYEEVRGEPLEEFVFVRAWNMCRELTASVSQATKDNVK